MGRRISPPVMVGNFAVGPADGEQEPYELRTVQVEARDKAEVVKHGREDPHRVVVAGRLQPFVPEQY